MTTQEVEMFIPSTKSSAGSFRFVKGSKNIPKKSALFVELSGPIKDLRGQKKLDSAATTLLIKEQEANRKIINENIAKLRSQRKTENARYKKKIDDAVKNRKEQLAFRRLTTGKNAIEPALAKAKLIERNVRTEVRKNKAFLKTLSGKNVKDIETIMNEARNYVAANKKAKKAGTVKSAKRVTIKKLQGI